VIDQTGTGKGIRAVILPLESETRNTSPCLTQATQAEPNPTASAYCGYGIVAPEQTLNAVAPGSGETGGGSGRTETTRSGSERFPSSTASLHAPARGSTSRTR
jgi:hypothetical protein